MLRRETVVSGGLGGGQCDVELVRLLTCAGGNLVLLSRARAAAPRQTPLRSFPICWTLACGEAPLSAVGPPSWPERSSAMAIRLSMYSTFAVDMPTRLDWQSCSPRNDFGMELHRSDRVASIPRRHVNLLYPWTCMYRVQQTTTSVSSMLCGADWPLSIETWAFMLHS